MSFIDCLEEFRNAVLESTDEIPNSGNLIMILVYSVCLMCVSYDKNVLIFPDWLNLSRVNKILVYSDNSATPQYGIDDFNCRLSSVQYLENVGSVNAN